MDQFGCRGATTGDKAQATPAEPRTVLEYNKELEDPLSGKKQTIYRSGVGILLHMMQFFGPDILNRVRELSSFMQEASRDCYKGLIRVMNLFVATRALGFIFKPNRPNSWD